MPLENGKKAPAFTAEIQDGTKVSLKDFKGKWVVLYFYPKDNTSGCTAEACDFRDNMERITAMDTVVIGVSPDSAKSHTNFIAKHNLNFNLITDKEKVILNKYDAMGEKKMYGRTYMGVIRTTYIIGPDGKIKHVFSPVKVKGHVDAVIEKLKELQQN
jgi:peroxiredoxin Q/BCP